MPKKQRYVSPVQFVTAYMTCRHHREYKPVHAPAVGEEMWCFRCQKYREVVNIPQVYGVRCVTCRYTRIKGAEKLGAEILASKHHNKHPSHLTILWLGKDLVREWKPQAETLPNMDIVGRGKVRTVQEIPGLGVEEPPF
jgi:hypothetical protein